MTSTSALELGGAGSVLALWSLIVVVIGTALFSYGIVVTIRGRNRRRRRQRPQAPESPRRPMPPPPASRPLAFPANLPAGPTAGGVPVGPTAGGLPVNRHLAVPPPRPLGAGPPARALGAGPPARTLGAGPPGRPIALPAGQPSTGRGPMPPALPASGYSSPPDRRPPPVMPPQFAAPTALPAGPIAGAGYGTTPLAGPPAPAGYGPAPIPLPAGLPPPSLPPGPASAPPHATGQVSAPPASRSTGSTRGRTDECRSLRAECERLREIATSTTAAAAAAATEAESAHADYLAAQRVADEARRHHAELALQTSQISTEMAHIERATTDDEQRLQAETTHAAFAAYRRGDITSDQLREVFKRAEGWTPEHDRLSKRSTELRAAEAEAIRARDAAVQLEHSSAERARTAALTARALDDKARTATADARGRCAAADACEQRNRRR